MCILAHPDDESIALGGTLAKYAAEGVEISLVVATRGERGWFGVPEENPGEGALATIREAELRAACAVLGVQRLDFLDYIDGDLDQATHECIITQLVRLIRLARPQVVITFGPDGLYGHPDHIAISQFTTSALLCAADPTYPAAQDLVAHRVAKLYYRIASSEWFTRFIPAFGDLVMTIDGQERRAHAWVPWVITTRVDACAYWERAFQAVLCHQTQLQHKELLSSLTVDDHYCFWGRQEFYRAFSIVNSGRQIEQDLFEGLYPVAQPRATTALDNVVFHTTALQPEIVFTP
jgi:LmbE family N-acetylglucosaminyl deacetylase